MQTDPIAAKRAQLAQRIRARQASRLRSAATWGGLAEALERENPSLERDIARMPERQLDELLAYYEPNRRQYVW